MQTRSLKTLLQIARSGSFATAAVQLNMTLSAVSMQIKSLETELGVDLFDRSFRPPKLTPLGRAVCDHAQTLMLAETTLVEACRSGDVLSGTFRIGFVATASVRLLPDFLINARRYAPNARFEIETGLSQVLQTYVQNGQLDAAVVTASAVPAPALGFETLRSERLVYAAPKEFGEFSLPQMFSQLPFFHFFPQSGIGKLIAKHIQPFSRHAGKRIVLDSVEAIMECVNNGIGFTLLPEPDVSRYKSDQSSIIEIEGTGIHRSLVLVTPARSSMRVQAERLAGLFG